MKIQNISIFFTSIFYALILNSAQTPTFTVLSWNVLGPNTLDVGNFFTKGDYRRLEEHIKIILNLKPDIVALQEIDGQAHDLLLQKFKTLFKTEKLILLNRQEKGANGGTALLINANKFKVINATGIPLQGTGKYPGAASLAIIESLQTKIQYHVASAHISRTSFPAGQADGDMQLNTLKLALSTPFPIIVAGDFNTNSPEINIHTIIHILPRFQDALPASAATIDNNNLAIDHILFKGVSQAAPTVLGAPTPAPIHTQIPSDHRWILATFADGTVSAPQQTKATSAFTKTPQPATAKTMPVTNPKAIFKNLLFSPLGQSIIDEAVALCLANAQDRVDIRLMNTLDPLLIQAILTDQTASNEFNDFVDNLVKPIRFGSSPRQKFHRLLQSIYVEDIENEMRRLKSAHPKGHVDLNQVQTIYPNLIQEILNNDDAKNSFNAWVKSL